MTTPASNRGRASHPAHRPSRKHWRIAAWLFLAAPCIGHGATQVAWVADPPDTLGSELGCGESLAERRAMAVDAAGNTYLAGCTRTAAGAGDGIVAMKIGPGGNLLWQHRHRNPANAQDLGMALALHPAGGVVVAGLSARVAGETVILLTTLRIDAAGTVLWSRQLPAGESIPVLAVDGGGNIFVAGGSPEGANGSDIRVVRYAADGTLSWQRDHDGAGHGDDLPSALAIGSAGSVYVTGASTDANARLAATTLHYGADGSLLWSHAVPGGTRNETARSIAVDASGHVVVAGTSRGVGEDSNMLVLRYSAGGSLLWDRRFDANAGNYEDTTYDMAVADDGSIAVAGRAANFGGWNFGTVVYAPDGSVRWARQYAGGNDPASAGSFDGATSVAIAASGYVIVAGESVPFESELGRQFATVAYRPDGSEAWVHRHGGEDGADTVAGAIAVAADGSLRVAGNRTMTDDETSIMLLKLLPQDEDAVFADGFE